MTKDNLPFALLGLLAARPEGGHGYQLRQECEALGDGRLQIHYGRLYRVLDLLCTAGDLDVIEEIQCGRPNRKVYRVTARGRRRLDNWLAEPIRDDARPIRDELGLKLLFVPPSDIERIDSLIHEQREICLARLAATSRRACRLEKAGLASRSTALILDRTTMRIRTDLAWLDLAERQLVLGEGKPPGRKVSTGAGPASGTADI